jgi:hypothetical protein
MTLFWSGLLLAALTVGALALASVKPARKKIDRADAAESRSNLNKPHAEALPITIRWGGFVPQELTKPAGDYYLSINNLSGVRDLVLRLDREHGNSPQEAKVSHQKPYWRQHVHLTPGTYLITEAGHPQWVCRITVTEP